jgi:hypothetical protein
MKLKMPTLPKMGKVLNDKNVLYIVFILAILNILGYLLAKNTEAIAFFLIVGFLTTYFSKNMIVVLLVAMVSTSIFTSTRMSFGKLGMSKEGMENKEGKKENDAKKIDDKDADDKDDASNADKVPKKEGFDDNKKTIPKMNDKTDKSKDEPVGAEAQKTKGTNGKNFVSQGDTLAEAYKNLEGMIGKDGIQGLTNQTETLLNQQHELMQNIKGMEPFIATAENLMSKLDLSSLDGIGSMLSNLGGKKE